jgi:hypothetical protein
MDKEIQFSELSIGDTFYDSYSGDFWTKISETKAVYEGYSKEFDYFEPSEIVVIKEV